MYHQLTRILLGALVHQVLKVNHRGITLSLLGIAQHPQLILAQIIGKNTDAGIGINHCCLLRNDTILKQKLRTEAVHITYKQLVKSCGIRHTFVYPVAHATGSSVGKGKACHLAKGYTMLSCPNNPFGQDCRFSTSWRR